MVHDDDSKSIRLEPKRGKGANVRITGGDEVGTFMVAMDVRVPHLNTAATARFGYKRNTQNSMFDSWFDAAFEMPFGSDILNGETRILVE